MVGDRLGFLVVAGLFGLAASACEQAPSGAAASSARSTPGLAGSGALRKGGGPRVIRSAVPKITEAAFMKSLDVELAATFAQMRTAKYRSRMHLAVDMGKRLQPRAMVNGTAKRMGVSDVSVLSLFAKSPAVREKVGARVKERAAEEGAKLKLQHEALPMVVVDDCREAAVKSLVMKEVVAGKRKLSPAEAMDSPLVRVLMGECKKAAEKQPELKCYVTAEDAAALKACK